MATYSVNAFGFNLGLKVKALMSLILSLYFASLSAQTNCCDNLVPNGSFEQFTSLPSNFADWFLATPWTNAAGDGNPDYYHINGTGSGSSLPDNLVVNGLFPQDGDAVMGVSLFNDFFQDRREYISVPLECPLTIGETYELSFFITLGNSAETGYWVCNNIAVALTTTPPIQTNTSPINLTPQFVIPQVVTSTNWEQYVFTFTATEEHEFLTFGNFENDANTTLNPVGTLPSISNAYYFVDNFSILPTGAQSTLPVVDLGPDFSTCNTGPITLDAGNPGSTYSWSTGASSQTIAVSSSGSFQVTVTNSCGSNQDEITVSFL
jgi:hypothetical protein